MKKLVFVGLSVGFLFLMQCATPAREDHQGKADSTITEEVNGFPDDGIFTFIVDSSATREKLDPSMEVSFMKAFKDYYRDSFEISKHQMFHNMFFSVQACMPGWIMQVDLKTKDDTELINWYLISLKPNFYSVSPPLSEDVTSRQGTATAVLDLTYSVDDECQVVAVKTLSEGGDIDYGLYETITLYSVNGGFDEILKLELERTTKEGYYNNPDSAKVKSKKRTFEFVTSNNPPFEVVAKVTDTESPATTEHYVWNGSVYKMKE